MCKRCTDRKLDCVYSPGASRVRRTTQGPQGPCMVALKQAPQEVQEEQPLSMDVCPVDDSTLVPKPGAATGSSSTSSLEPSPPELSSDYPMKPLAPPAHQQPPCQPQIMASRSLTAPAQATGFSADYSAVSGDRRPQAQGAKNPLPSQTPASYVYANNPMYQSTPYAAQQAQYAGLPPSRHPSLYYNYSQPPVMQQRSQTQPAHYTPSGQYVQYVFFCFWSSVRVPA